MNEYDKKEWQAEQVARDAAIEARNAKWIKAKARAARNAQRKIDRLARKLSEDGNLTDWEEEFAGSVSDRLDKFGSAFQDPEKGRPADALSFAQKKVVAALNKKVKDQKATARKADKPGEERKRFKVRGGFKNKNYRPRVRNIEDDLPDLDSEPFIPEVSASDPKPPFLRIVK